MKKIFYIIIILLLVLIVYLIINRDLDYIKLNYGFKYKTNEIKKADPKNDGNIYLYLKFKNRKIKTYNIYYSYNSNPFKINIKKIDNYYVIILEESKTYISFYNRDGLHIDTIDGIFDNIDITDSVKVNIKEENTITYKYYVKDDILFKEIDNIIH